MIISNVSNLNNIKKVIKLPNEPHKHIWNSLREIPVANRMKALSKLHPESAVILSYTRTYKNTWKEIYYFVTHHKSVFIYFNEEDYILLKEKKVIKRKGNGISRFVSKMFEPNYIETELAKITSLEKVKAFKKLFNNKDFVQKIEFIFENLEVSTDILYSLMRPTQIDVYLFKIYYVVWFKQCQDPEFLRHFKGECKFEAETLVEALKQYLQVEININDIYEDLEEDIVDCNYIDFLNEDACVFA